MDSNINSEKKIRIQKFLELANSSRGRAAVDRTYTYIRKYDSPKDADRNFLFECLIEFYASVEEYERCALLQTQLDLPRKSKKITARGLTLEDIISLQALSYEVPIDVIEKVMLKYNK